jgi:hypothetical protein
MFRCLNTINIIKHNIPYNKSPNALVDTLDVEIFINIFFGVNKYLSSDAVEIYVGKLNIPLKKPDIIPYDTVEKAYSPNISSAFHPFNSPTTLPK